MTRLRDRLADERGWGLVSSVLVIGILVAMALPLLSLVDAQQRQAAHERKSESSFNLAEAAFDAGVFVLSTQWPARGAGAFPASCTAASTGVSCPDAGILARTFAGTDYRARAWTVRFRDDGAGSEYYDAAQVDAQPTWDANGNARMWVRADGRAADGTRSIVALVRRQDKFEPFPRNTVTAGWFGTATGGHKLIVDTKGTAGQPAPIAVRCTATTAPPSPGCLEYLPGSQVSPDVTYTGYIGDTAVPEDALERFRSRAKALGTYYQACPASPVGELVFIENGNCGYAGGGVANSKGAPGMMIVARGTVNLAGGMTYYGLVYAANLQRSTAEVVTLSGGATIHGSVAVDWGGGFRIGSAGENMVYDDSVFPLIKSFGSAAPIQGTWRELPGS